MAVAACDSVTFWGLDDSVSWLNWFLWPGLDPLLFDESLQPKPAYFAVRDRLASGQRDGVRAGPQRARAPVESLYNSTTPSTGARP